MTKQNERTDGGTLDSRSIWTAEQCPGFDDSLVPTQETPSPYLCHGCQSIWRVGSEFTGGNTGITLHGLMAYSEMILLWKPRDRGIQMQVGEEAYQVNHKGQVIRSMFREMMERPSPPGTGERWVRKRETGRSWKSYLVQRNYQGS